MKKTILLLLFIFFYACKDHKSIKNENKSEVIKTVIDDNIDAQKEGNKKYWFFGKSFEYVIKETKDSLIIGDYLSSGKAITFLSKDTLLISDHLDGVTLKIDKVKTNEKDSINIIASSFHDSADKVVLGIYLINQNDSLWTIDDFGYKFYAVNNLSPKSDFFICSSNLKYKMITNTNKLEDPLMFEEEEDSIPYYYKIKK